MLGAAFLFDVLGAIGDFVVEAFDFQSETEILGMLCVFFEERIPLGFQIVAFFLPDTGFGEHARTPQMECAPLFGCCIGPRLKAAKRVVGTVMAGRNPLVLAVPGIFPWLASFPRV